jgi:hypothetical protein
MGENYILNQNEYLFLHTVFQSEFAWGVQSGFADKDAERKAMETALTTLQEKEYLSLEADQIYLDPELWSLMNVCTDPQQVLLFTYVNRHDDQDLRFVYWGDDMLVEDRVLSTNSRQLQRVGTALDLAQRLKAQLKLAQQPQASGAAQTLPSAALEEVQQSAPQGKDVVLDKLVQAGIEETSANSLAQAYTTPIANSVLTRILPGEEGRVANMILIESAEGLWEMHTLDADQIHIAPVDAKAAWQMITAFCGAENADSVQA